MPSSVPKTLRLALRDGTRSAHERVDAEASQFHLDKIADYRAFLAWHAALVPAIEEEMSAAGIERILPDWADRRRGQHLGADLSALGGVLPRPTPRPPLDTSDAGLVGAVYVLEGSRLGGAMLLRSVHPVARESATRYLAHGEGLRLWPRFVEQLNDLEFSGAEIEIAVASAIAVFDTFEHELAQHRSIGAQTGT